MIGSTKLPVTLLMSLDNTLAKSVTANLFKWSNIYVHLIELIDILINQNFFLFELVINDQNKY